MMRKDRFTLGLAIAGPFLFGVATEVAANGDVFISGLAPDRRPANAPVITEVFKDQAWYARALTGVTWPYPNSLRFLDNQGNWYTPFNRPGMTGLYDIRGWHQRP